MLKSNYLYLIGIILISGLLVSYDKNSDAESVWTVKDLSASTLTMEMYEKETENNVVTYEFYEIDTYHKITNNLN